MVLHEKNSADKKNVCLEVDGVGGLGPCGLLLKPMRPR
jgi:hypothetical protein